MTVGLVLPDALNQRTGHGDVAAALRKPRDVLFVVGIVGELAAVPKVGKCPRGYGRSGTACFDLRVR
jgi:hypothetical protein